MIEETAKLDDVKNYESNGHVETIDAHEDERPVKIKERDGTVSEYVVKEMTGTDQAWWMKRVGNRVQVSRSGKPIKQDYEGMHADLIHLCLYDRDGKRVNKQLIQSWGPKALNRLFAICQDINGLTDKVSEVEGKD